jgi:hypothetical protein
MSLGELIDAGKDVVTSVTLSTGPGYFYELVTTGEIPVDIKMITWKYLLASMSQKMLVNLRTYPGVRTAINAIRKVTNSRLESRERLNSYSDVGDVSIIGPCFATKSGSSDDNVLGTMDGVSVAAGIVSTGFCKIDQDVIQAVILLVADTMAMVPTDIQLVSSDRYTKDGFIRDVDTFIVDVDTSTSIGDRIIAPDGRGCKIPEGKNERKIQVIAYGQTHNLDKLTERLGKRLVTHDSKIIRGIAAIDINEFF